MKAETQGAAGWHLEAPRAGDPSGSPTKAPAMQVTPPFSEAGSWGTSAWWEFNEEGGPAQV